MTETFLPTNLPDRMEVTPDADRRATVFKENGLDNSAGDGAFEAAVRQLLLQEFDKWIGEIADLYRTRAMPEVFYMMVRPEEVKGVLRKGGRETRCVHAADAKALASVAGTFGFIRVKATRDELAALEDEKLATSYVGSRHHQRWRLEVTPAGLARLAAAGKLARA